MKKSKFVYKNSIKNDLIANILILVISALLIFMSARFFEDKKTVSIIIYACAIAFSYCRIAVEAIEKALAKRFDGDIIATAGILIIFAAQKFYAAALIAVFYAASRYFFELINSDFSDKLTKYDEYKLFYKVANGDEYTDKLADEIVAGDKILVNKGDYLCFSYTTEGNGKAVKAGIFSGEDQTTVTVVKVTQYEIDFKQSKEPKSECSSAERNVRIITLAYTALAVLGGLAYFTYNYISSKDVFASLFYLGVFLVLANPFSIDSGIATASAFNLIRLKKAGILLENSAQAERMSHVKKIYLDQSGVVTKGEYEISQVYSTQDYSENDVLGFAASVCDEGSKYYSVFAPYKSEKVFENVILGSAKIMAQNGIDISALPDKLLYVACGEAAVGALKISDVLPRENANALKIAAVYEMNTFIVGDECEQSMQRTAELCNSQYICTDDINSVVHNEKSTAYIGADKQIQTGFCAGVDSSDANYIEKGALPEFIKRIKSLSSLNIFIYVRAAIGIVCNIAAGLFVLSPTVYNYFHDMTVITEYEENTKNIINTVLKFMIFEDHMAAWIIVFVQILIINVFMGLSLAFINDDKKLH